MYKLPLSFKATPYGTCKVRPMTRHYWRQRESTHGTGEWVGPRANLGFVHKSRMHKAINSWCVNHEAQIQKKRNRHRIFAEKINYCKFVISKTWKLREKEQCYDVCLGNRLRRWMNSSRSLSLTDLGFSGNEPFGPFYENWLINYFRKTLKNKSVFKEWRRGEYGEAKITRLTTVGISVEKWFLHFTPDACI
jgi:hypothetical protein